jgi:hypothetical protein
VSAWVTWFSILRRRIVNTATVVFWVSVLLLGMVLILAAACRPSGRL